LFDRTYTRVHVFDACSHTFHSYIWSRSRSTSRSKTNWNNIVHCTIYNVKTTKNTIKRNVPQILIFNFFFFFLFFRFFLLCFCIEFFFFGICNCIIEWTNKQIISQNLTKIVTLRQSVLANIFIAMRGKHSKNLQKNYSSRFSNVLGFSNVMHVDMYTNKFVNVLFYLDLKLHSFIKST
jgi:hypothetical protein